MIFHWGEGGKDVNKHLMTGPKGNSEFCFPEAKQREIPHRIVRVIPHRIGFILSAHGASHVIAKIFRSFALVASHTIEKIKSFVTLVV